MRVKLVVTLLFACLVGIVAVGAATAKVKPKPKAKPKPAKFDTRFDCANVAPGSLVTSLAGGFGGTFSLKPKTHLAQVDTNGKGSGGFSHCDYDESAIPYPWAATAEGPGEVTILYGAAAIDYFKRDHAAAVEGVKCDKMKAQNPNLVVDPRQCGPIPVTGIGTQAYEAASYIAVLRGKVFLQIGISSQWPGSPPVPPADLLESMATALLTRLPAA